MITSELHDSCPPAVAITLRRISAGRCETISTFGRCSNSAAYAVGFDGGDTIFACCAHLDRVLCDAMDGR